MSTTYQPMTGQSEWALAARTTIIILGVAGVLGGLGALAYFFVPTYQAYSSGSETRASITATLSLILPYLSSSTNRFLATDSHGTVVAGPDTASFLQLASNASFTTDAVYSNSLSTYSITLPHATANQMLVTDNAGLVTSAPIPSFSVSPSLLFNASLLVPANAPVLASNTQNELVPASVSSTATPSSIVQYTPSGGLQATEMAITPGPLTIGGLVTAQSGIRTPFLNANFLSTDALGNIVASSLSYSNLTGGGGGATTINQVFVPNVMGNFNVSGRTQTGTLRITGQQGTAYDYATIAADGSVTGAQASTAATANTLVKRDGGGGVTANTGTFTALAVGSNTYPTTACTAGQIMTATAPGQLRCADGIASLTTSSLIVGSNVFASDGCPVGTILGADSIANYITCGTSIGRVAYPSAPPTLVANVPLPYLRLSGAGQAAWSNRVINSISLPKSGTSFTVPSWVTIGWFTMWGGGGGGGVGCGAGNNKYNGGAGGAGGQYISSIAPAVEAGMTFAYSIGGGGIGGAFGTNSASASGTAAGTTFLTINGVQLNALGGTGGAGGSCTQSNIDAGINHAYTGPGPTQYFTYSAGQSGYGGGTAQAGASTAKYSGGRSSSVVSYQSPGGGGGASFAGAGGDGGCATASTSLEGNAGGPGAGGGGGCALASANAYYYGGNGGDGGIILNYLV